VKFKFEGGMGKGGYCDASRF